MGMGVVLDALTQNTVDEDQPFNAVLISNNLWCKLLSVSHLHLQ